jgi:redox-sensitive bicupin YhaK (pirin superfamily)
MSLTLKRPRALSADRGITHRTTGHNHGAVTRLFSPGDLGGVIKPFVFLDRIHLTASDKALFGFHPHSGIATVTTVVEGDTAYEDSTGKAGVLIAGGVEWMQAGGGVWHTANPTTPGPVRGYQLWLALPAALEGAEPRSGLASEKWRVLLSERGPR